MIRYASPVRAEVDVGHRGEIYWERYRRILEIDDDHTARLYREVLSTSRGPSTREPTVLTGRVTNYVAGSRLSVRVQRADSDKAVHLDVVADGGELIGELYSGFTQSRHGILLTPQDGAPLFPPPLPAPDREAPPAPTAAPTTPREPPSVSREPAPPSTPSPPVMTLAPGAPAHGDAFTRAWARLNRHLRRHQGRASTLKLRDLSDAQTAFVRELFAGPLATLEQDALDDLRDFYAAEPGRRLHVNVTALTLPTEPGGPWEITLGESAWAGVVIVYRLDGWRVTDRTLVG